MRVTVFHGPGQPFTVEDAPIPVPGENDVLVKIERCGICGSDISMTSGGPCDYPLGVHMGHEWAGEVVEIGRQVTRLKVGDRVCTPATGGCGACEVCLRGRQVECPNGMLLFGGFGDFVTSPQQATYRVPQSLSLVDTALVEPIACGRRAMHMADLQRGQRVLVLGAGSMAMAAVFWASRLGAGEVIVSTRSSHRREATMAMGATRFHGADQDDPEELEHILRDPPDIVVECVGKPGMISAAIERVRFGGAVVSLGMCMTPEPLLPILACLKEARLTFPFAYSTEDLVETIKAFDSGEVDPSVIVGETISIEEVPAMLDRLRAGEHHPKIMVDPSLSAPR
jgi:(R,R)-butanediol dehydrogenase/meso-butanediol dehydrogenase/diacetyl reductase